MAGGLDVSVEMKVDGKLYPAAASLQNCLKFSYNFEYLSILCDFGVTTVLKVDDKPSGPEGVVCKTLKHNEQSLEGHTWSTDDKIYAVLSQKAYLYMVQKDFSLIHIIELYYVPKDIAISNERKNGLDTLQYKTAIAGPNGVEMYHLEITQNTAAINVKEGIHLHNDLAIVLVEFSPDLQYLVVAALDCHFGIWNVKSLEGEQKDFWYKHLPTIRITSVSFSDDSNNVAVACWDGSCYIFTKESQASQWHQCSYKLQSSGERICGILTGSIACWSPDSKTVRFSFVNEEGSWLSTTNPPHEKLSTHKAAEKGTEIKGLDTLRCSSGDFSVCFLNSKVLLMTGWPD